LVFIRIFQVRARLSIRYLHDGLIVTMKDIILRSVNGLSKAKAKAQSQSQSQRKAMARGQARAGRHTFLMCITLISPELPSNCSRYLLCTSYFIFLGLA
jgi:hypothetical protein